MNDVEDIALGLINELKFAEKTAWAWARAGGRCVYCFRDLITDRFGYACGEMDHLIPTNDNVVLACRPCNHVKGTYNPLRENEILDTMLQENISELISRAREFINCRNLNQHDPEWETAKRIFFL